MKKKIMPIVALAALLSMSACTTTRDSSPNNSMPSSTETPSAPISSVTSSEVSSETSSSSESSSSSDTTIHVTSIELVLEKTKLFVGQTTTATVTVTPSDATDATYSLISSDTNVATVSGNTITAVNAGNAKITATSTDGAKVSEVNLVVEEVPAPTLTIEGEKTLTVAAGESLNLPAVSAEDYLGNDLTE